MKPLRNIGNTDIQITPIAMGCWPISGVTSVDVTEQASRATLNAAFESGINFLTPRIAMVMKEKAND